MPQKVTNDDNKLTKSVADQTDTVENNSIWRKLCVPCFILVVASLICVSQLQLAFETKYEYHYKVKDINEDGDGETYSYNMWKGVQSVYALTTHTYIPLHTCSIYPSLSLSLLATHKWDPHSRQ
jgi:hypothetical protein